MKAVIKDILIDLLVIAFAALFNFICFDCAEKVAITQQTKDTCVTLQATISSSDHYTEIDEGYEEDYWHVNVTYTYDGVTYNDVRYDTTRRAPDIGKVVTVKIDPKNPGELLPDTTETTLSMILPPIFLTGVTAALYHVIKDIVQLLASRLGKENTSLAKTVALVFTGIKLAGESILFYRNHGSLVFAIFAMIAAVAFYFFFLRKSKKQTEDVEEQPV